MSRLVFAGTPDFALASLQALVEAGRAPVAVLTQPDRPAGRGRKLTASPVKRYAQQRGIDVLQPRSLGDADAAEALAGLEPDLLVVAAYGLILPQAVLDIPVHGCLNVHASALPRWRGAAPIQAAILAGDATTGISLMAMTAGLDCGPVYHVETIDIGAGETAGELHDRLAALGGAVLVRHLDRILAGAAAVEQDDSRATYAPKIEKQDAEIDWTRPADEVVRRIRAYNPFPGAFTRAETGRRQGVRIKVWRAAATAGEGRPGSLLQFDRDGITVACGSGAVSLLELQVAGKRRATASEFAGQIDLAGHGFEAT